MTSKPISVRRELEPIATLIPDSNQKCAAQEELATSRIIADETIHNTHAASKISQIFSSFNHRNYQLWFSGQLVSVIGTWMQSIAQGWLVYQLSHSEFALGLVSFAAAIPALILSPFGGVITDLIPKRTLIVITQSIAMLLAFILSILAFTGTVQVWHIMILATCLGIVNAFDAPARQAFVVEMVGKEDLPNAIALNSMMFNGARVVGPALGGILLGWLGTGWCFLLNGVSFIAVIIGLLMMSVPKRTIQRKIQKPLQQFAEGIRFARSRPDILGLLGMSAGFSAFGMAYAAMLPAFVDKQLHAGATAYGMINAAIGIGAVLGALAVAYYTNAGIRGKVLVIGNLIYPVLLVVFGFNTFFVTALLIAFGMGLTFMQIGNNINSLLQLNVEDDMRGRVMGLYTLTFFGFAPLGSLAAGIVAQYLPLNITIAIMAVVMLLISVLIQWRVPEIREMS